MGNYSDYAAKKQQLRDIRLKEYLNQQQEIKHQEAVIESFVLSTVKNPSNVPKAVKDVGKDADHRKTDRS